MRNRATQNGKLNIISSYLSLSASPSACSIAWNQRRTWAWIPLAVGFLEGTRNPLLALSPPSVIPASSLALRKLTLSAAPDCVEERTPLINVGGKKGKGEDSFKDVKLLRANKLGKNQGKAGSDDVSSALLPSLGGSF